MPVALRKWIGRVLYGGGALLVTAALAYRYRLDYEVVHAPLQPFVATGNVIVRASHGAAHYITAEQAQALALSLQALLLGVAAIAVGVFLEWGWNLLRRRS